MKKEPKPNIEKIVNASSASRTENLQAKIDALEIFFDVLKALLNREIGDNPTEVEIKDAVYIAKFIQGLLANCLLYWRDHGRLPIIQYCIFSNPKGRSIVDMYASPSTGIYDAYKMDILAKNLIDATNDWDLELDQSDVELPSLAEMSKGAINTMEAYSAIQKLIDEQPVDPKGSKKR